MAETIEVSKTEETMPLDGGGIATINTRGAQYDKVHALMEEFLGHYPVDRLGRMATLKYAGL